MITDFCFLMRKQKETPFQYLTARCALLSDINQDSASGMLAGCGSFKLRAKAPISAQRATRAESFFRRRKDNENIRLPIAATIDTAWLLLSIAGPLRCKHKIIALAAAG